MGKLLKDKLTWKNVRKQLLKSLVVLIGTFLVAFGSSTFLVPFNIISGGLSGLGIILETFIPIGIDVIILILTWVLFFLGLIFLGPTFAANTLISTIFYPLFVSLVLRTGMGEFLVELLINESVTISTTDDVLTLVGLETLETGRLILCGLVGGALVGFGVGITFIGGGSTGGVDILCFIINKFTGIKASTITFLIDGGIVLAGLIMNIVNKSSYGVLASLVGVFSAVLSSIMIEFIYVRRLGAYYVDVITDKYDELRDRVIENLDRSVTIYDVVGGYTNEPKKCVRIIFSRDELIKVKDLIAEIDNEAFMIIGECQNVNGEGFTPLKSSKENTFSDIKKLVSDTKTDEDIKEEVKKDDNIEEIVRNKNGK